MAAAPEIVVRRRDSAGISLVAPLAGFDVA
jgi:hypothetical protein